MWRRDFTANALYYNIADFSIWDYAGGVEDIAARRLKLIGDPVTRYREDPVRMLRAARFEAKLGFSLDGETGTAIRSLRELLGSVPPARLFDETLKLFLTGHGAMSLVVLQRHGLLAELLPTVASYLERHPDGAVARLVRQGLVNTDQRVAAGKPVTPTFLFALLLYGPFAEIIEKQPQEKWHDIGTIVDAVDRAARGAQGRISIPKRFSLGVREMFAAQPRLEQPRGRRALRMLEQPRFRAGFDLLLLRADMGLASRELADWWTKRAGSFADRSRPHGRRTRARSSVPRVKAAVVLAVAARVGGAAGVGAHPRPHECSVGRGSHARPPFAGCRHTSAWAATSPTRSAGHARVRRRSAACRAAASSSARRCTAREPLGEVVQPPFVNAVAGLAHAARRRKNLLAALRATRARTRPRAAARTLGSARHRPRPAGGRARRRARPDTLTLPHAGIAERDFVLYPLADIAPDLDVPGLGKRRGAAGPRRRTAASSYCEYAGRRERNSGVRPLPAQRYIVVEGPIGVGKTSLANRLAETLEAELVLEQDAQNPFLERFYRNQKSGALPAQLFFLFQRAQQLGTLKQQDLFAPRRVADYLFEKDRLFAGLTLDSAEMALYEQVASRLAWIRRSRTWWSTCRRPWKRCCSESPSAAFPTRAASTPPILRGSTMRTRVSSTSSTRRRCSS